MSLATIITNLATTGGNVTGIASSFDIDELPGPLNDAALPALLHLPAGGENVRATMGSDGDYDMTHRITVLLLYKAVGQGTAKVNYAAIVALIDSYIQAIRDDDTLSSACIDARVTPYSEPGVIMWADVAYHGVQFTVEALEYIE